MPFVSMHTLHSLLVLLAFSGRSSGFPVQKDWSLTVEQFTFAACASTLCPDPPQAAVPIKISSGPTQASLQWELRSGFPGENHRSRPDNVSIYYREIHDNEQVPRLDEVPLDEWWVIRRIFALSLQEIQGAGPATFRPVPIRRLAPGRRYMMRLISQNEAGRVDIRTKPFETEEYLTAQCSLTKKNVRVGEKASAKCQVEGGPNLTLSSLQSWENSQVLRRPVTHGYSVNIVYDRATLSLNEKEHCIRASTTRLVETRCFSFIINDEEVREPPVLGEGMQPRINNSLSESTTNSLTIHWNSLTISQSQAKIKVAIKTRLYAFESLLSSVKQSYTFTDLQPGTNYRVSVSVVLETTELSSATVHIKTQKEAFVHCSHSVYNYSMTQENTQPLLISCRYGGHPTPKLIVPHHFDAVRVNSTLRLAAASTASDVNGSHCVKLYQNLTGQPLIAKTSCFEVFVKQPLNVRTVETTSPDRSSLAIIKCFVTGFPLPKPGKLHWLFNNNTLLPDVSNEPRPSWLRRNFPCKQKQRTRSGIRFATCTLRINRKKLAEHQGASGKFTCRAANAFSAHEASVTVHSITGLSHPNLLET